MFCRSWPPPLPTHPNTQQFGADCRARGRTRGGHSRWRTSTTTNASISWVCRPSPPRRHPHSAPPSPPFPRSLRSLRPKDARDGPRDVRGPSEGRLVVRGGPEGCASAGGTSGRNPEGGPPAAPPSPPSPRAGSIPVVGDCGDLTALSAVGRHWPRVPWLLWSPFKSYVTAARPRCGGGEGGRNGLMSPPPRMMQGNTAVCNGGDRKGPRVQ